MTSTSDPHAGQPVLQWGAPVTAARAAMILIHGRGASAEDMGRLSRAFATDDVAFLAPQAEGRTWYPYSFLAPIPDNEPGITSGLRVLAVLVASLQQGGLPPERVVLLGFSQGACLAQEFAARHARRYGAVIGLSGGLIGPPGTPRCYDGSLDGTPVFLGCSDVDPHIPVERVHESAEAFRRLDARVDERIYPGMGHVVNRDETDAVGALVAAV